ncbi:adenosylcobinamide-phosphate synthase CbiB [uncultured Sphingomonas sp.]|uniref:adenosylcobinamide-phosphate synthase CbiB n=1 Tax=uncultured Sphingomonas sp. TaxID=158754 RepID=UPI0035CA851D
MHAATMLAALALEGVLGWPDAVHRRIGHPVSWLGAFVDRLDATLNRPGFGPAVRYLLGMVATIAVVAVAVGTALAIAAVPGPIGIGVEIGAAATLVAARGLYAHVDAVRHAIEHDGIAAGRIAVARIVGRDVTPLDEAGVARAAIESLAENLSDGVVAPLFWGAVAGLPGIAAYKAINTLDSMIGHRTARHEAFGGFAARLDDLANLIPARLTAGLIAVAAWSWAAARIAWRDARRHRSPNAGWPEAAMAGALGIRLSGPRRYGDRTADEPWLNPAGTDPDAAAIGQALSVAVRAVLLAAGLLAAATFA